jgi:hypothetical protein
MNGRVYSYDRPRVKNTTEPKNGCTSATAIKAALTARIVPNNDPLVKKIFLVDSVGFARTASITRWPERE